MSTVQAGDVIAVYRGGKLYHAPADMSTVQDTDLIVVGRGNTPYKCTFLDWKNSQGKAPAIGGATLADSPEAGRFTSGTFATTVSGYDAGTPAATVGLKAWVEGALVSRLISTNAVTAVSNTPQGAWASHATPGSSLSAIAHNAGKWVVAWANAISDILTSTDGTTYTKLSIGGKANTVAFIGGKFVIGSRGGVFVSADGATWLHHALPGLGTNDVQSLGFGGGAYIAGANDGKLYRSTDAQTWAQIATFPGSTARSIAYFDDHFVAVGNGGGAMKSNADGSTWTQFSIAGSSANFTSVARKGGIYLAAAGGSVFTSTDESTWTPASVTGMEVVGIFSSEGYFIALGATPGWASGAIAVSTDGVNWTQQTMPAGSKTVSGLTEANGSYYACGDSGLVYTSTVGYTDLTIAGAQTDGFKVGDYVENKNSGGVGGDLMSVSDTTVRVAPHDNAWAIGDKLYGLPHVRANVKLYCQLDSTLNVTDLQSPDPGFKPVTGAGPYSIKFPATLPSGNPPDTDLPAGTTITTEVQATNTAGTATKTSNTVTPA